MLDLKYISENKDAVQQSLQNRNMNFDINPLVELDAQRRSLIQETEQLKSEKNKVSKEIGQLIKEKKDITEIRKQVETVSTRIKECDDHLKQIETQVQEILLQIPNIPHESVPVGKSAANNIMIKEWGTKKEFTFTPKNHIELCADLDIIDFGRASKISGTGFAVYKGLGAKLERALISFMLDYHTTHHGYTEIFPPFLVNKTSMTGTGQLPKLADDMYTLADDGLYLIPTAEVPVTNLHSNEILNENELPIYYSAYSACFRREAGSYGKDTKGLKRVHQFNKVELVKFVKPEDSWNEHEKLLKNAEKILQLLELPYRTLLLCTGDQSFAASKCYDLEAWSNATQEFLEVSSCSNFTDFQARRAGIRYRNTESNKTEFVHTLNSSGLATPRTMICLLENNQNEDGSITIPEVLRPYMGGLDIIK